MRGYQINPGEYINAASIVLIRPSSFHGITLGGTPDKPWGWMVLPTPPSISAGTVPTKGVKAIARYTPIAVYETTKVGELTWYRIGDNQGGDQKVTVQSVSDLYHKDTKDFGPSAVANRKT